VLTLEKDSKKGKGKARECPVALDVDNASENGSGVYLFNENLRLNVS
jgi:hypothetical protein